MIRVIMLVCACVFHSLLSKGTATTISPSCDMPAVFVDRLVRNCTSVTVWEAELLESPAACNIKETIVERSDKFQWFSV